MTAARTCLMVALAARRCATPAAAQGKIDSEAFLEAIEEQRNDDGDRARHASKGRAIINMRGYSGETPLTLAMRKRATLYVNYLLQHGADPNIADKQGDTALMIAARARQSRGDRVDARRQGGGRRHQPPGRNRADHRHPEPPRPGGPRLLEAGASATRTDNAGLSARDYALRDRRSADMLRLIDTVKKKPVFEAGPVL